MVKTILVVIGMSALICSAFALTLTPDDEAARDAALQWLRVVDSGKYEDAALQMSQETRAQQNWSNYFATHRAPLGRVKNRQMIEVKHASTVPGDPEVRPHAIMRFKTSFERNPAVIEEVVTTKMGCCWEVSGYSITAVTRLRQGYGAASE